MWPLGLPGFGSGSRWAQELWFLGSRVQAWYLWGTGLTALYHVESSRTRDQMCVSCMGGRFLPLSHQGSPKEFFLVGKSAWSFPSLTFPASLGWTHYLLCLYGPLRRTQTWAAQWLLPRCHWRLRNPAEWISEWQGPACGLPRRAGWPGGWAALRQRTPLQTLFPGPRYHPASVWLLKTPLEDLWEAPTCFPSSFLVYLCLFLITLTKDSTCEGFQELGSEVSSTPLLQPVSFCKLSEDLPEPRTSLPLAPREIGAGGRLHQGVTLNDIWKWELKRNMRGDWMERCRKQWKQRLILRPKGGVIQEAPGSGDPRGRGAAGEAGTALRLAALRGHVLVPVWLLAYWHSTLCWISDLPFTFAII